MTGSIGIHSFAEPFGPAHLAWVAASSRARAVLIQLRSPGNLLRRWDGGAEDPQLPCANYCGINGRRVPATLAAREPHGSAQPGPTM